MSAFALVFSLGFGFGSLPELRNFIAAAACFRMQSLLQYTESGCATLEHPGPMHLAAPGASATCGMKHVTSDSTFGPWAVTALCKVTTHSTEVTAVCQQTVF